MTDNALATITYSMGNKDRIKILQAFGDNYIYLVKYGADLCFVVDPGQADVVVHEIDRKGLNLTHILLTHHHQDHIGGVDALKRQTSCEVISPDKQRIKSTDIVISKDENLEIGDMQIQCVATPGHTATSVCYYVTGGGMSKPALFSGDTLFVCGCGRMLECDGETMFASLQMLAVLPGQTLVYPGHNYTEESVRFALTLTPENQQLQKKLREVHDIIEQNKPTVPSTLNEEKRLNPFLAAGNSQRFTQIRQQKDIF